jgi:hypothetical protein
MGMAARNFGPVATIMDDPRVPLKQDTTTPAKPVAKAEQKAGRFSIPLGKEVLVVCVDVIGKDGGLDVRDGFDQNDEYVATASPLGDKYVQAFDRFGKPRSVPQQQFKLVAAVEA